MSDATASKHYVPPNAVHSDRYTRWNNFGIITEERWMTSGWLWKSLKHRVTGLKLREIYVDKS